MENYYRNSYMDRVSWFLPWGKRPNGSKGPPFVQALLEAGADEIWLPENKPSVKGAHGEIGNMLMDLFPGKNVYEDRIHNGLQFTWHQYADHPSFHATDKQEVDELFRSMYPPKLGARLNVDFYLHEGVNGVPGKCMLCVKQNPDFHSSQERLSTSEESDDSIDLVRSIF